MHNNVCVIMFLYIHWGGGGEKMDRVGWIFFFYFLFLSWEREGFYLGKGEAEW